ncbi:Transcription Termination Factor 2 [Manis pentadactyla]|nr:Transcription Termination Factor 2 [Manis pentadactyla]
MHDRHSKSSSEFVALVADLHPESCCCINVFLFELRTTNWIVLVALTLKTNQRQAEAVSDLLNREGASTPSRSRRRCSLELEVGLLSNLCAEETQMLASAPRLNSADRPMKTSVLRQRKGSIRKQHLLSWAWQQGRGQVLEILRSAKQTER